MRILLVEDDYSVARIIEISLRAHGHEVDHARDHEAARRLMDGHDLVLLDVLLGDGHVGTELLGCFDVPVLVLTSLDERGLIEFGADLSSATGQVYHVKKPKTPRELLLIMASVMEARALLNEMLTGSPDDADLADHMALFVEEHGPLPAHARDVDLMRRWLDLPPPGKTEEENGPYLQLLNETRVYLGKKK